MFIALPFVPGIEALHSNLTGSPGLHLVIYGVLMILVMIYYPAGFSGIYGGAYLAWVDPDEPVGEPAGELPTGRGFTAFVLDKLIRFNPCGRHALAGGRQADGPARDRSDDA